MHKNEALFVQVTTYDTIFDWLFGLLWLLLWVPSDSLLKLN